MKTNQSISGLSSAVLVIGLILALAGIYIDVHYTFLNLGGDGRILFRFLLIPVLFVASLIMALFGRRRRSIRTVRFFLGLLALGNFIKMGAVILSSFALWDIFIEELGLAREQIFIFFDIVPYYGIDPLFDILNFYPFYSRGSIYAPYLANIITCLLLFRLLKRSVLQQNEAGTAEDRKAPQKSATRELGIPSSGISLKGRSASPSLEGVLRTVVQGDSTGLKNEGDVERLLRMIRDAEEKTVKRRAVMEEEPYPVGTLPQKERSAPQGRKSGSWNVKTVGSPRQRWVVLLEAAAIGNPRRYVDELLAREPGLGGEGSLIVQERLDPYPGLLELNALLPRESRGGAASARNFVDGRGNRGMILSI